MNIDAMLDRHRTGSYDCRALAVEAWRAATGCDLRAAIEGQAGGRVRAGGLTRVTAPVSPCVVVLSAGARAPAHVGIFYEGRLLHLGRNVAEYVPLEFVAPLFKRVRYYACS